MPISHLTAAEAADALRQLQQRLAGEVPIIVRAQQDALVQAIHALEVTAALGPVARIELVPFRVAGYYDLPPADDADLDVPQLVDLLVVAIQSQAEALAPDGPTECWACSTAVRLLRALNAVACGRSPALWLDA